MVAEKVMGWKFWREQRGEYTYIVVQKGDREPWQAYRDAKAKAANYTPIAASEIDRHRMIVTTMDTWQPTRDIAVAWQVVEQWGALPVRMEQDGEVVAGWSCTVTTHGGTYEAWASNVCVAICLAALKAVGVDTTELEKELKEAR